MLTILNGLQSCQLGQELRLVSEQRVRYKQSMA